MVQAAGDVPPEAMARMTTAEARLYPLAMVDPSRYERATTLVGLVAAELRGCRRVDEVLARREGLLAALPRLADGSGVGRPTWCPPTWSTPRRRWSAARSRRSAPQPRGTPASTRPVGPAGSGSSWRPTRRR